MGVLASFSCFVLSLYVIIVLSSLVFDNFVLFFLFVFLRNLPMLCILVAQSCLFSYLVDNLLKDCMQVIFFFFLLFPEWFLASGVIPEYQEMYNPLP